jgi:hypothetical protein
MTAAGVQGMAAARVQGIAASIMAMLLLSASSAQAQTGFVNQARAGTAHYRSVDSAISDGFKRVGVEFPAMGEHWVNLPRVLENRFDPARPSVLIYITARGKRELAGVAYTSLLSAGQRPPASAAKLGDWHEHNGSVAEESLPLHHAAGMSSAAAPDAPRLSILHAWVWTPNPAGLFVTDNWTLPLERLGAPSRPMTADALRGLTLAADSSGYYELTLRTSLDLADAESRAIAGIVERHRRGARASSSETALAAAWTGLWADLERALPRRTADLRAVRARL